MASHVAFYYGCSLALTEAGKVVGDASSNRVNGRLSNAKNCSQLHHLLPTSSVAYRGEPEAEL